MVEIDFTLEHIDFLVSLWYHLAMPRKVRELIADLKSAGFIDRGKGSHRNFVHGKGTRITISGKAGDDAKPYQEKAVRKALEEVK
jgi:predicted RNA binding protein YcfA (HicA-like mRNA interferase family)